MVENHVLVIYVYIAKYILLNIVSHDPHDPYKRIFYIIIQQTKREIIIIDQSVCILRDHNGL